MRLLVVSHPCVVPINQELFARLEARCGWDVSIVVPAAWKSEYGSRSPARWPHFRGPLISLPVLFSGSVPLHLYARRLTRVIAESRPEVIYVHNESYAACTFQVFSANRRSARSPIGFYSAQNLVKRHPWPFPALEQYVYRRADFATPISGAAADVLRSKGYQGQAAIIPLALDTNFYRPDHGQPAPTDGNGTLTIGYVGRISPEKGVGTILTALALLPGTVRALIAGDGPDRIPLMKRARALGLQDRITWVGYVAHDQTPHIYRKVDLIVVPSRTVPRWKEQFGRVVIEALACGIPVVTSDSGELPHLVSATGGGWTFPEGDGTALAAIIEGVLDRPADVRDRGTHGRAAVEAQFDIDAVAVRFARFVEQRVAAAQSQTILN